MKDYRPEDIELLEKKGLHRIWVHLWQKEIHKEISDMELTSENQRLWHVSRISFLKGYETAKSESPSKDGAEL